MDGMKLNRIENGKIAHGDFSAVNRYDTISFFSAPFAFGPSVGLQALSKV